MTPKLAPAVSNLQVSPRSFSAEGRKVHGRCVKLSKKNKRDEPCQLSIRLKTTYTLNAAVTVSFKLALKTTGRKVSGKCVKATHKNKRHSKCTLLFSVHQAITRSRGRRGRTSSASRASSRQGACRADCDPGGRHVPDGHVRGHGLTGSSSAGLRRDGSRRGNPVAHPRRSRDRGAACEHSRAGPRTVGSIPHSRRRSTVMIPSPYRPEGVRSPSDP